MPKKKNKDVREIALTVGSAALAAPALSVPLVWVLVSLGLRLVAGSFRRAQAAGEPGPSIGTVVNTLEAGIRRAPSRTVPSVLVGVFTLAMAFALVAVYVGVPWVAAKGTDGWLVAVRLAEYEHLLPLFCALVCWRILRGRKGNGGVVEPLFDSFLQPTTQTRLLIAGAPCLLMIALFVFVTPRAPWAPWGSFEAAVGSLPAATRDAIFDLRRDLASAETRAVLDCIELEQGDLGWRYKVLDGAKRGTLTLRVTRARRGDSPRADRSGVVLALHHQLSRGVTELSVQRRPNIGRLVIDRTRVPQTRPQDDTESLAAAAGVDPQTLPYNDVVKSVGLRCGAKAL